MHPRRRPRNTRAPFATTIVPVEPDPDEDDDNLDGGTAPADQSDWNATLRRREAAVLRRGGSLNVVMTLHWEAAVEIERHHTGRRRWMFRGVAYVDVTDFAVR